ncbi:hypothetical protein PACID_04840 [Acidipropionibacterium acidipropionici ATCC 4875]|uniref:Uncharacterized protein n=1 Tax=Acidipropionibacterium acidipropionici (strain ATCC 4875 / DSM 20272 / JCM 6432 / NBRC 12425 / NCIMB 8070 / 4) TaxID=1171373 RepID=K7SGC7_ACIA4|nr:hypothetical protein PACID_04840 [Acidipropionibacterium acidipropionici ATCC 4875]
MAPHETDCERLPAVPCGRQSRPVYLCSPAPRSPPARARHHTLEAGVKTGGEGFCYNLITAVTVLQRSAR